MCSLLILRHADAEPARSFGCDDAARPLTSAGQAQSAAIGKFLARTGETPDSAVTSSAIRARTTLQLAMAAGRWSCPDRSTTALNGQGVGGILAEIHQESASTGVLLVVGHEPTLSATANLLIGGGNLHFSPATIARIDFEAKSWEEIAPRTGVLAWMVAPHLLG